MKPLQASLTLLDIPFRLPITHATKRRVSCDSVVIRIETEDSSVGWGEGAPRPYVGGEDGKSVFKEVEEVLWPSVAGRDLPDYNGDFLALVRGIQDLLPDSEGAGALVAHHAARCAVELALLDCQLRRSGASLGAALAPVRTELHYNGMLPTGDPKLARQVAKLMASMGLQAIKVKVGDGDDLARIHQLRGIVGEGTTLLADANGAWSLDEALEVIPQLAAAGVAVIEQPLPRGPVEELAELRRAVSLPIMVDESLVTLSDARELIAAEACDIFNVRLSKCGGIGRSLEFIDLARKAGLSWQLGCHVGETAILSAAGRAVALSVDDPIFVEGSIGEWLLEEDLTSPPVQLAERGRAVGLEGPGLGIDVLQERVERYGVRTSHLGGAP